MADPRLDFRVRKDDLRKGEWTTVPEAKLAEGEARLRVDRFVITANNITYAAAGSGALAYWRFFPSDEGWGRVPVWGFATVAESRTEGLEAGTRVYGYLPMSTTLTVRPQVTGAGFVDASAHRAGLPAVYNQYSRVTPELELTDAQMVVRPLFGTAFLIDDVLEDNGFYGAERVIVSSASSRTAIGLAYMLARRGGAVRIVGLTSARNRSFVEGLGYYDEVVTYDEAGSLPVAPSALVDMSGDAPVLMAVHSRLGDALKHSMTVGATHWDKGVAERPAMPGPTPEFFFAPSQMMKRAADWGPGGFQKRYAPAWEDFSRAAAGWLRSVQHRGQAGVETAYGLVVSGEAGPDEGHIVSLS